MSVVSAVAKQILPLFDRIVVQRAAAETKSRGGILIPEKAQNKGLEATVVAVGPGLRDGSGSFIPLCVAVGDKVLLPEYGGSKLEMEGEEELTIFREHDIVAKLN
eukprot:TRINITY_DN1870_c0_g1_i1.p1 TRINITY_DN1870_c0_g1~~TRINITY_DN1870_c0_g1_i1.p1  ORF type:complete len:105 (-),score=30.63 TRINITY_DN1870_c0_g1_i1:99-413(-)